MAWLGDGLIQEACRVADEINSPIRRYLQSMKECMEAITGRVQCCVGRAVGQQEDASSKFAANVVTSFMIEVSEKDRSFIPKFIA